MSSAQSVRSNDYNQTAVRELLLAAFSESGLRRFFLDDLRFRFLCKHCADRFGLADLVNILLRQCLQHQLLPGLLVAIQSANPSQHTHFAGWLLGDSDSATLATLFPGPSRGRVCRKGNW